MWKFIPVLIILPGILPCLPDLKDIPSVRGVQASNLFIEDRQKVYWPPTPPKINRTHWSADGEPAIQRLLNEDGSDVHCDPAKVPSKEIVLRTIGLLKKGNQNTPGHSLMIGIPQKPPVLPRLEM